MRAETRHHLKQDAFSRVTIGAAEKTAHWSVEHRNTLAIAALVVIVIGVAVAGGWYYLSVQDEKASFDMSQAVRTLEAQLRPAGTPAQPDVPSFGEQSNGAVATGRTLSDQQSAARRQTYLRADQERQSRPGSGTDRDPKTDGTEVGLHRENAGEEQSGFVEQSLFNRKLATGGPNRLVCGV